MFLFATSGWSVLLCTVLLHPWVAPVAVYFLFALHCCKIEQEGVEER